MGDRGSTDNQQKQPKTERPRVHGNPGYTGLPVMRPPVHGGAYTGPPCGQQNEPWARSKR